MFMGSNEKNMAYVVLHLYASGKHDYIMLTPLTPLLCSKPGVYRIYIIFLISAQNSSSRQF